MAKPTCLCIDLRTAANHLTQIYDKGMSASGISATQFSQLHMILSLQGPSLKDLAAASQLERSTLGRNIRVLEKMGLVTLKTGDDARTRTIHLSRKGKNIYKRAVPLWHGVQEQMLERLGHSGRDPLDRILEMLTAPVVAI
jgi:DNA-binding MarR family transcriptional regulator